MSKLYNSIKKYWNLIINWYLFPYASTLIVVLPIVYFFSRNIYQDESTWNGVLIEAHGMIFDIIIIGLLVTVISKRREKRLEIERYKDEIDDYRGWETQEASQRISGLIRRLDKRNKSKYLNLSSCRLSNAQLSNVNLQGAQLAGANLQRAHLDEANLQGAYLMLTNLQMARLNKANLQGVSGLNANLQRAHLKRANLQRANLTCANLRGAFLNGANLQEANLEGACLQGVNLKGANLKGAIIELYQLQFAEINQTVTMPNGTMYDAKWKKKIAQAYVPKYYLEECNKTA